MSAEGSLLKDNCPSNMNLDEGKPFATNAVVAAHGPGIQIIFKLLNLASLTRFSPGSQMLGIPASLTNATDLPSLRKVIIFGIFFVELCILKLISSFFISYLDKIFFVCRVSSQAIKETLFRIFSALNVISNKFPIGVPTIYRAPLSGSSFMCKDRKSIFIL